jgi:hypothetical protein
VDRDCRGAHVNLVRVYGFAALGPVPSPLGTVKSPVPDQ